MRDGVWVRMSEFPLHENVRGLKYIVMHMFILAETEAKLSRYPVSMWMFMSLFDTLNNCRFLFLFDFFLLSCVQKFERRTHLSLNGHHPDANKCEIFIAIETQFLFQFRQITYPWTWSQWSSFFFCNFHIKFYEKKILNVHPSVMHTCSIQLYATENGDKKF